MSESIRNAGKKFEIAHWENKFSKEDGNSAYFTRTNNKNLELAKDIVKLLPKGVPIEKISILDVGSGPLSVLGKKINGKNYELIAVDPLKQSYSELLNSKEISIDYPFFEGTVENLSSLFPDKKFDIVFSQNALDHAGNPFLGIISMLSVCKDDGFLFFSVFHNEAINCNYVGFYQWNFSPLDTHILLYNQSKSFLLEEVVSGLPYVFTYNPAKNEKKKYSATITIIVHNIPTNSLKKIKIREGLYLHYNTTFGSVSLTVDDKCNSQEKEPITSGRFFIHFKQGSEIVDNFSFTWDFDIKTKSRVSQKRFDSICVGQYEIVWENNKQKSLRQWDYTHYIY